jgi:hypothetical protein
MVLLQSLLITPKLNMCVQVRTPGSPAPAAAAAAAAEQGHSAISATSASSSQPTLHDFWGSTVPSPRPHYALQFDLTSPSYYLLRGSLVMRHKSNVHWTPLIETTLRAEYNLPVARAPFDPASEGIGEEALDLLAAARSQAAAEADVPFSSELLLSEDERDELRQLSRSGTSLSALQRQQLYTTAVFRDRWGITDDSLFDNDFYVNYVGQVTKSSATEGARKKFYAFRRQVVGWVWCVCVCVCVCLCVCVCVCEGCCVCVCVCVCVLGGGGGGH